MPHGLSHRILRRVRISSLVVKKSPVGETGGYFSWLPKEIVLQILQYLVVDPLSLCNVCATCKYLKEIAESDSLWSCILAQFPPMVSMVIPQPETGKFRAYYQKYQGYFNVRPDTDKVVLVGGVGNGKTSLVYRLLQDRFISPYEIDGLEDSYHRKIEIDGSECVLEIGHLSESVI